MVKKQELVHIGPTKLVKHMMSLELYGERPVDGFEEAVKSEGVREPILLAADGKTIISGIRRRNAAIKSGHRTVPCVIMKDAKDENHIRKLIIDSNKQMERSNEVKAREFKILKEIEAELAEQRRNSQLKKGSESPVVANLPQRENSKKSRDLAAQQVGLGARTAEKAAEVVEEIDRAEQNGQKEKAEELRETLNKSVSAAHQKVSGGKKKPKRREISPAKLVDELMRKYVSPLVRGIDAVAQINGGKGECHELANQSLNTLIVTLKKMRGGLQ